MVVQNFLDLKAGKYQENIFNFFFLIPDKLLINLDGKSEGFVAMRIDLVGGDRSSRPVTVE